MSKIRQRKLKAMMQAVGLIPPPPEPPRIITQVAVPWFSTEDEWPEHVEAYRAMLAKSRYGVLVDSPECVRTPFADERERFEAFAMAHQHWLTHEGAELGAEPNTQVWERLRQQFRTWTPTSQAA